VRTEANAEQHINRDAEFQKFVMDGINDIKGKLSAVELSLNFQAQRIDDLEGKLLPTEAKVRDLEKTVNKHELLLTKMADAENKLERFSRKNNFRIIGSREKFNETPAKVLKEVKTILDTYFKMEDPKIERAHRDGKVKTNGQSRHIIVKMLSYQEKLAIMTKQREKLSEVAMYITDDLTQQDLAEKKKWKENAQTAYHAGTKYHFAGGKWRGKRGELAAVYNTDQPAIAARDQDPNQDEEDAEDA
jgi:hypothetical protein